MTHKISPLAPKTIYEMPPIEGVRLATAESGMRYNGRDDVMLAVFDKGTKVAGVFTKSSMPGVPVDWCRSIIKKGRASALLVNAGISNVFTGKQGIKIVKDSVNAVAKILRCRTDEIYISSTGIIGQQIDEKLLINTIPELYKNLKPNNYEAAAKAIITTDTFIKLATRTTKIGGTKVTINGFTKGSGMIAPNMATMLVYLFTDASLNSNILQKLVNEGVEQSFNAITVDSDTSTSDTLLLFASQKVKHKTVKNVNDPLLKNFKKALFEVMLELAHMVVKDGEGATKFITVNVGGAVGKTSAKKIGLSIANSPLVKTAIAGEDANWGRIVAAIGKSGEKANRDRLSIKIGNVVIAKNGAVNQNYNEAEIKPYMKGNNIEITVNVGVGKDKATVWTCDLTHEYISINADYRS